jgi:shikimate kinase
MEEQEPLAAEPTRIYLVGMPGSGKSTAGPLLAETLGWRFEDLDRQIEAGAGISIPRFFEEKGEEAFRVTETRLLHKTAAERRLVVATGGGAVLRNIDWMLEHGRVVWLDPPISELVARLADAYKERPLLSTTSSLDLPRAVETLYRERRPFYARAHDRVSDGEALLINFVR